MGQTNVGIAYTERACRQARQDYLQNSNNIGNALALARACFERAELASDEATLTTLGKEGVEASRHALSLAATNAGAHYYLALNIGEIARIKRMSGLKLVDNMEEECLAACKLDEKLDYAGPDRCLGLLYRDAPGWPISIGSRAKARKHLQHALDLSPDYPENWINMIESYLEWNESARARETAVGMDERLSKARVKLSGDPWAASWNDWDARWKKLQQKLSNKAKSNK